jgi:hypothetical protein
MQGGVPLTPPGLFSRSTAVRRVFAPLRFPQGDLKMLTV